MMHVPGEGDDETRALEGPPRLDMTTVEAGQGSHRRHRMSGLRLHPHDATRRALADEDRHGYAIIQEVAMRTGGDLKLSAGTLYRSIQRLLEQGLIVETRDRPAPAEDDERRRYYRITPEGTAAARQEARRLAQLVKMARAKGLAPGRA